MKKILLNLLLLFFLISCGGIKKDPEVVKYIIDKVNTDIEMVIPRGEIDTSINSNFNFIFFLNFYYSNSKKTKNMLL